MHLIHKSGDDSAARIGNKKRDENVSSTEELIHPI